MKYLCLIYLDDKRMQALPAGEMNALNAGHLDYNDALRRSGTGNEDFGCYVALVDVA